MKDHYEANISFTNQEKCKHGYIKPFCKDCFDPYETQGSPLRVHHPVQPKTQVERWWEERGENLVFIVKHHYQKLLIEDSAEVLKECDLQGTDNCYHRFTVKIPELEALILADHEKNKTYLNRYPTGTSADDKCNCAEISCKVGCKNKHTHKTFSCEKCNPRVTLLDKIKKTLW